LYILAKDHFRTRLSRLYSISIFPPYLFCNPPVPTAREMFYAFSSRTNVPSESYGGREYRDILQRYRFMQTSNSTLGWGLREELKGVKGCMQIPANLVSWSCWHVHQTAEVGAIGQTTKRISWFGWDGGT